MLGLFFRSSISPRRNAFREQDELEHRIEAIAFLDRGLDDELGLRRSEQAIVAQHRNNFV